MVDGLIKDQKDTITAIEENIFKINELKHIIDQMEKEESLINY